MISKEPSLPYDRPKLSKSLTSSADEIRLRNPAYFEQADVEIMTEVDVVGVDTKEKTVKLNLGDDIKFDKLILATGSTPRTIDCEGKYKLIILSHRLSLFFFVNRQRIIERIYPSNTSRCE